VEKKELWKKKKRNDNGETGRILEIGQKKSVRIIFLIYNKM